jgi:Nucleotidyltransferase domain
MANGWIVPDTGFTEAKERAARDVIESELGGRARVGLAYLGGSFAAGLGNATSDVDLYVVSEDELPGQLVFERGGAAVHVAAVDADYVRSLVAAGSAYTATGMDRAQIALDSRPLTGLVRLLTGWRLVCSGYWTHVLAGLRRDVVRQIIIARHANRFGAFAEDVAGALASGDLHTCALASAIALEAAAEATLAAADDIYDGQKFLFRRLSRTDVTRPWVPILWQSLNQAFSEWPDPAEFTDETGAAGAADGADRMRVIAERRLLIGNFLLSYCALNGWDEPLRSLPAPGSVASSSRSPYFVPVRFSDGWALMGPGQGYEVNEALVRLWRDANSATEGVGPRALTAIGALASEAPPVLGPPARLDPELARQVGIQWAPRFQIHPATDPAVKAPPRQGNELVGDRQ